MYEAHNIPRPFPIRPGMVLGQRYRLHKLLSQGGCGKVFSALDLRSEELVALKTFRDSLIACQDRLSDFTNEAMLWVNLGRHPHLLEAHGVESFNNRLFIVMEYIAPDAAGRSNLLDHIGHARGPLAPEQCVDWALQFCAGMTAATERGVRCHRDIKPQNILISQGGVLKIADFGLACPAEQAADDHWTARPFTMCSEPIDESIQHADSWSSVISGTPGYMAPEVLIGRRADIRSDIYSFGLVMLQMTTGSVGSPVAPEGRMSRADCLLKTYQVQVKKRLFIPKTGLEQIIARCLEPNPPSRYRSFAEMGEELMKVAEQLSVIPLKVSAQRDEDPDYWLNRSVSMLVLERKEEALEYIKKAVTLAPYDPQVLTTHAQILAAMGRYDMAERSLRTAKTLNPDFGPAWRVLGELCEQKNKPKIAIHCYRMALKWDLRDLQACVGMARNLIQVPDEGDAEVAYAKCIELDVRSAFVWENRGLFYCHKGCTERAVDDFSMARTLDPMSETPLVNIGRAFSLANAHMRSLEFYQKALELNPVCIEALGNSGASYAELEKHQSAIDCYRSALSVSPDVAWIHYNLGLSLLPLGRYEDAMGSFRRALESNGSGLYWHCLGVAAAWCHDLGYALKCWKLALRAEIPCGPALEHQTRALMGCSLESLTSGPLLAATKSLNRVWSPAIPRQRPSLPCRFPSSHDNRPGQSASGKPTTQIDKTSPTVSPLRGSGHQAPGSVRLSKGLVPQRPSCRYRQSLPVSTKEQTATRVSTRRPFLDGGHPKPHRPLASTRRT